MSEAMFTLMRMNLKMLFKVSELQCPKRYVLDSSPPILKTPICAGRQCTHLSASAVTVESKRLDHVKRIFMIFTVSPWHLLFTPQPRFDPVL